MRTSELRARSAAWWSAVTEIDGPGWVAIGICLFATLWSLGSAFAWGFLDGDIGYGVLMLAIGALDLFLAYVCWRSAKQRAQARRLEREAREVAAPGRAEDRFEMLYPPRWPYE